MANISFNTVALFNAAKSTLVGDSGADTLGLGYDTLGSPPTAVVFNDSTLGDPAAEPAHFFLTHFTSLNFDRPLHGPSLLSNRIVVQLFLQLSEMRPSYGTPVKKICVFVIPALKILPQTAPEIDPYKFF